MTNDNLIYGRAALRFKKFHAPNRVQVAPFPDGSDATLVFLTDLDPEALHALAAAWLDDIYESAGEQNPWVKAHD